MTYSTEENYNDIIKSRIEEYSSVLEKETEMKKLWSSINLDDEFYSINNHGQVVDPKGNEIFHIPNIAYKECWDCKKVKDFCLDKIKILDEEEYDDY